MNFKDTYKTISSCSEGVFKEKGSKFIAMAFPVSTENEVKGKLEELRKEYYDARHHCYAYQIGFENYNYRINDDGEPSGTAGKPIYGQIQSKDLTNILIVVIRYFGGTKLGVSGLINAYRSATKEALNNSSIITKTVNDIFIINFEYPEMNNVMRIVKDESVVQISHTFELNCSIKISVRKGLSSVVLEKINKIKNVEVKYLRTV